MPGPRNALAIALTITTLAVSACARQHTLAEGVDALVEAAGSSSFLSLKAAADAEGQWAGFTATVLVDGAPRLVVLDRAGDEPLVSDAPAELRDAATFDAGGFDAARAERLAEDSPCPDGRTGYGVTTTTGGLLHEFGPCTDGYAWALLDERPMATGTDWWEPGTLESLWAEALTAAGVAEFTSVQANRGGTLSFSGRADEVCGPAMDVDVLRTLAGGPGADSTQLNHSPGSIRTLCGRSGSATGPVTGGQFLECVAEATSAQGVAAAELQYVRLSAGSSGCEYA